MPADALSRVQAAAAGGTVPMPTDEADHAAEHQKLNHNNNRKRRDSHKGVTFDAYPPPAMLSPPPSGHGPSTSLPISVSDFDMTPKAAALMGGLRSGELAVRFVPACVFVSVSFHACARVCLHRHLSCLCPCPVSEAVQITSDLLFLFFYHLCFGLCECASGL